MALFDELNKPVGEVALSAGVINGPNRDSALEVQKRAVAFYAAKPEAASKYFRESLRNLGNENTWNMLMKLNGITESQEMAASKLVREGQGVPDGVPRLGQIVISMGFVQPEIFNAILSAQAGARAQAALKGIDVLAPTPRDTDPEFLKKAQQLVINIKSSEGPLNDLDKFAYGKTADTVLSEAANRLEFGGITKLSSAIRADVASRTGNAQVQPQALPNVGSAIAR